MEHLTCKGLVIRETDFGDTDRYISVLTEEGRRIEVLCKQTTDTAVCQDCSNGTCPPA